jgi:hypothetical protein
MPSNSEMFERGAQDAEHDELNSFYYQHYYYYRQGYDQSRRRVRAGGRPPLAALLGLAVLLLSLGLGGGWWLSGRAGAPAPVETLAPTLPVMPPPVQPTARPSATALPTVAPTLAPTLALGGQALVTNLNGSPLRARQGPGLTPIVARIAEGSAVTLREGPVEADGYTWWRVESASASGWVAERSPEGVVFLEPLP